MSQEPDDRVVVELKERLATQAEMIRDLAGIGQELGRALSTVQRSIRRLNGRLERLEAKVARLTGEEQ